MQRNGIAVCYHLFLEQEQGKKQEKEERQNLLSFILFPFHPCPVHRASQDLETKSSFFLSMPPVKITCVYYMYHCWFWLHVISSRQASKQAKTTQESGRWCQAYSLSLSVCVSLSLSLSLSLCHSCSPLALTLLLQMKLIYLIPDPQSTQNPRTYSNIYLRILFSSQKAKAYAGISPDLFDLPSLRLHKIHSGKAPLTLFSTIERRWAIG